MKVFASARDGNGTKTYRIASILKRKKTKDNVCTNKETNKTANEDMKKNRNSNFL